MHKVMSCPRRGKMSHRKAPSLYDITNHQVDKYCVMLAHGDFIKVSCDTCRYMSNSKHREMCWYPELYVANLGRNIR